MQNFRIIGDPLLHSLLAVLILVSCSCKSKTSGHDSQISFSIPAITLSTRTDSITMGKLPYTYTVTDDSFQKQIHLTATLTNNTAALIKYYSMTCSWPDLFTTNTHSFSVFKNLCFSNWWFVDTIYPHGTRSYHLTVATDTATKENKVKLGFNLIKDIDVPDTKYVIDSLQKMNHLIWSNPITLQLNQ